LISLVLKERLFPLLKQYKTNLILAIVPLLAALILFFSFFWPSLEALRQTNTLLAKKKALLEEYQHRIKEAGELKFPKKESSRYLFTGKDPYVVVSIVQEQMKDIERLSIRSFQIRSQTKFLGEIKKVQVYFNMEGDVRSLVEMLERLQNLEKALIIKNLILSRMVKGKREYLQINLQIEGLFRPTSSFST